MSDDEHEVTRRRRELEAELDVLVASEELIRLKGLKRRDPAKEREAKDRLGNAKNRLEEIRHPGRAERVAAAREQARVARGDAAAEAAPTVVVEEG